MAARTAQGRSTQGRVRPPVAVTVDIALLTIRDDALSILLVERAAPPFRGTWALPGGFVEPDEDLDAAARRELAEETGIATDGTTHEPPAHLEQLRTYGTPGRDPRARVVTVAYLAMVPETAEPVAASDAATARFWAVDDLALEPGEPGTPLAFDHGTIVADAVERARAKLEYTTLATAFVDAQFTLADLRRVYECVWGIDLHEGNFRRKVLGTEGFVTPTAERTRATGGRPAQLYEPGPATQLHPPILRQAARED